MKVYIHDDVYKLIGEISSSSDESEVNKDGELESYLMIVANSIPNSQGMAKMKQTAHKTDKQGLPLALGRDSQQQQQLMPAEFDSDSSLECEFHSPMSMGSKGGAPANRRCTGRNVGPVPTQSGGFRKEEEA